MSSPEDITPLAPASGITPAPTEPSPNIPGSHLRVWIPLIVLGLLGTGVAWAVGEGAFTFFAAPTSQLTIMGSKQVVSTRNDQVVAETKNEALAFGTMGAVLGLFLGIAGGWVRGSVKLSVVAGVVGLLLGGVIGAAFSLGALPFYNTFRDENTPNLAPVMLLHLLVFGGIGATSGFAFGIGTGARGAWYKAMVGGLIGAIAGAVLAELIAAVLFPNDKTNLPVSITWISRLLYRGLIGLTIILGVGFAVADPRRPFSRISR